jgi:hypothetical protein
MEKIYSKNSNKINNLNPKAETINFILNYSKGMHVIKSKRMVFEMYKN